MEPKGTLPLTEATYLVLLALAPGPAHGYAILQRVADMADGRSQLGTGTLYTGIKRMHDQGWIERRDRDEVAAAGPPRKTYALTELGRAVLRAESERLLCLVRLAQGFDVLATP